MSENGNGIDEEPAFVQTVPVTPWEISLKSAGWWFQRMPGGAMLLKFVPVTQDGQGGTALMPPAVEVMFGADGWQTFQEEVAAGEKKPQIQTATALPDGLANRRARRHPNG
jgi:hypothetical protein